MKKSKKIDRPKYEINYYFLISSQATQETNHPLWETTDSIMAQESLRKEFFESYIPSIITSESEKYIIKVILLWYFKNIKRSAYLILDMDLRQIKRNIKSIMTQLIQMDEPDRKSKALLVIMWFYHMYNSRITQNQSLMYPIIQHIGFYESQQRKILCYEDSNVSFINEKLTLGFVFETLSNKFDEVKNTILSIGENGRFFPELPMDGVLWLAKKRNTLHADDPNYLRIDHISHVPDTFCYNGDECVNEECRRKHPRDISRMKPFETQLRTLINKITDSTKDKLIQAVVARVRDEVDMANIIKSKTILTLVNCALKNCYEYNTIICERLEVMPEYQGILNEYKEELTASIRDRMDKLDVMEDYDVRNTQYKRLMNLYASYIKQSVFSMDDLDDLYKSMCFNQSRRFHLYYLYSTETIRKLITEGLFMIPKNVILLASKESGDSRVRLEAESMVEYMKRALDEKKKNDDIFGF